MTRPSESFMGFNFLFNRSSKMAPWLVAAGYEPTVYAKRGVNRALMTQTCDKRHNKNDDKVLVGMGQMACLNEQTAIFQSRPSVLCGGPLKCSITFSL